MSLVRLFFFASFAFNISSDAVRILEVTSVTSKDVSMVLFWPRSKAQALWT